MTNVRMCTGKLAGEPYFLNNVCTNIYSIEELCYLFALNPFMITSEIMDEGLVDWIENECGLSDLASSLRPMFKRGSQVGEFAHRILDYVRYCDETELKTIDDTLKNSSGLNDLQRRKKQADYLVSNQKYESAIEEYEALLLKLPEVESALKPSILQNMGYSYAKLFMFDIAAKYYRRAFEITHSLEAGVQLLAAMRMYVSDEKYLNFISSNEDLVNSSLQLEKQVNAALGDFEGSTENLMLNALNIYKDEGNVASYYDEIDRVIDGLKDQYLKQVLD